MNRRNDRPYLLLCAAVSCLSGMLLVYSQTAAFAWDEGFHLLCAQNILRGKLPYRDFVFSQTPLNAFWNAFWMRLFGDTWRTAHAVAAICTGSAIFLAADFVYTRISKAAAFGVAFLIGMNVLVVDFGTVGQAYGLCLLLIVAAFRTAIAAGEGNPFFAIAAGLLSGAAANASLLTAPVAPVLLTFLTLRKRSSAAWFVAGGLAACLPLLYLFWISPANVWFGIFEYNFLYRGVQWQTATQHNIEVFLSWIDSGDALLLIGLLVLAFRNKERRTEFYVCAWLALALAVHISTARPTFTRYYLFVVPFLAILCTPIMKTPRRVAAITAFLAIGLAKSLYQERDELRWSDMEAIARKVEEVTPPGASLAAVEHIYFLTRRPAPSGMELEDSHKLEFELSRASRLHLLPGSELRKLVDSGAFSTVETCDDLVPPGRYLHKFEFPEEGCTVYWGLVK